jgi:glycosyltransferase involved in cell wall biosynthesis/GT2 family glycosyltransferase
MISVILSTFNNEGTIFHCIKSILNQSYKNFELIIINDCSNDKTKEVIKSFDDKRIVYFENLSNIGRSKSRNKAIKNAKGNFIAIMDGDDIAVPKRLEVQINYLKNNPQIDLVASNVIFFNQNKVLGKSELMLRTSNNFIFYLRASELPHSTWMARASFFEKFKYDAEMDKSEDSDLLFRARHSVKCSLLKNHLVFYRIPIKDDISYKLQQIYLLYLSRIKKIYNQKLFYLLPLISIGLISSSIFYILRFKKIKMSFALNSKYQNLLDKITNNNHKITNNNQIMIINIISSIKGGGAETIVNELHKNYLKKDLESYVIYYVGENINIKKNYFLLDLNPRNPISIFYLRKIIKKIAITTKKDLIVHAHLTWPFFYTALAVLGIKNIKLFFTEHDTQNKRMKIPFFNLVDHFFYSYYLCIICISKGVHNALVQWIGPKIKKNLKIVYNGSRIYKLCKRTSLKNRLPRLISIGRLTYKKNFLTTIAAISKIKENIESYTIIGEGNERDYLIKLITKLKLENKVILAGWQENVEEYLQKADIQLIPSLYEGFGLVAVEGMSTGLPVVASNVPGMNEVLGVASSSIVLINKIDSIKEWEKGIYKVIKNIKKFGSYKIAKSSQRKAEKFSFKKMTDEYLNIYRNKIIK